MNIFTIQYNAILIKELLHLKILSHTCTISRELIVSLAHSLFYDDINSYKLCWYQQPNHWSKQTLSNHAYCLFTLTAPTLHIISFSLRLIPEIEQRIFIQYLAKNATFSQRHETDINCQSTAQELVSSIKWSSSKSFTRTCKLRCCLPKKQLQILNRNRFNI